MNPILLSTAARMQLVFLAFAAVLALVTTAKADNAPIIWGSATTISGDSDVVNTGTLVGAFNIGTTGVSATTVNGVTFAPFAIPWPSGPPGSAYTVGNFSLSSSGIFNSTNTGFGSASTPFAGLSGAYQTLLSAGTYEYSTVSMSLSISGLTIGQNYIFEWWTNNSGQAYLFGTQGTIATATNSVSLVDNAGQIPGSLGQYAIGTFTANSGSESITFDANLAVPPGGTPEINAFQLRAATPEPSSAALLTLGAGALFGWRRRNRSGT